MSFGLDFTDSNDMGDIPSPSFSFDSKYNHVPGVHQLQSTDILLGSLDEEHQIVVLQKKVERHALSSRIHLITDNDHRWKTSARSPTLKSDCGP